MYLPAGQSPLGAMNGDTQYDGAALGENAHVSASEAYMALASAKAAINAARAAAVAGNCGQTQELLGTAWAALMRYSQMAAAVGQSPATALKLHKVLAQIETMSAMRCSQLQGAGPSAPSGMVQQQPASPVQRNEVHDNTKRWLIGGAIVGGLALAGIAIWAATREDDSE